MTAPNGRAIILKVSLIMKTWLSCAVMAICESLFMCSVSPCNLQTDVSMKEKHIG